MSFPFPSDRLALARTDFCEAPSVVRHAASWDQKICQLRARQCATHIQATGDRAWAHRAAAPLNGLVAPGEIEGWVGAPGQVKARASGACGLLGAREPEYRDELWQTLGRPRAEIMYRAVGGEQADEAADSPAQLQTTPLGSRGWLLQELASYRRPEQQAPR